MGKKSDLVEYFDNDIEINQEGNTLVYVAINGQIAGVISLNDQPRPEAKSVVMEMKKMGIQVWMATGDSISSAKRIAQSVGISEENIIASSLPKDKAAKIQELQNNGQTSVGMIGDGINDSPALAIADVGFAVARGTNDLSLEAADVVLMKNDLRDALHAISLSRITFWTIRWNFLYAFMYNTVAVVIAFGAIYPYSLDPGLAGLSELLSSVPVVLFSLLLNFYKPRRLAQFLLSSERSDE